MTADGAGQMQRIIADMIAGLRAAQSKFREEDGRLAGSHMSLLAIMKMVGTHPVVREEGLLAPLGALLAAITETAVGGKPDLFFEVATKANGRPPDSRLDGMRGTVAFCIELLVGSGRLSRSDAGAFVASEAKRLGLLGEGGRPISARAALRYRENFRSGNSKGADALFLLKAMQRAKHPPPGNAEAAKSEVTATLDLFLKSSGY